MATSTQTKNRPDSVYRVSPDEIQRQPQPTAADREQHLERLRKMTHWLDHAFQVPGTNFRVGWDSILGLVPFLGDAVTTGMAVYIMREAQKHGVSRWTLLRMLSNIGVDFAVGLVPGLGDLFDAAFKANSKNMRLLEKHLERKDLEQKQR